jgi:hypothetical protein
MHTGEQIKAAVEATAEELKQISANESLLRLPSE